MRDNEYVIAFTYGMRQEGSTGKDQWWCDLFQSSPAAQADQRMKLASGHGEDMAGAMAHCAMNWAEGYR